MIECPIHYFTDNLIFGRDKSCWGVFEIVGFDYDLLSDDRKKAIFKRLTLFIANIESEAKFKIVPVVQDVDRIFEDLINGLQKSDVLYEDAVNQATATKNYLKENIEQNGKSNDYKTFIAIKLQKENEVIEQAKEFFKFIIRGIINDFNVFMNIDSKDIQESKVENYTKLSKKVCFEQSKRLELLPVDTDTIQWLLKRDMYRGMPGELQLFKKSKEQWKPHVKEVDLAGKKYLRPGKELANLFHGKIEKVGRSLKIEHEEGVSYQTFLVVANIPNDDLSFPDDAEWIYLLQQYNQQIEICIHIRTVEYDAAKTKIEGQRRTANSQVENIEKAGAEIPDDLMESKEEIESLEAELKSAKLPLIQTSVVICLSDIDLEKLNNKANFIRNEYKDLNFVIERPLTDQFSLFMQCIPSVSFTEQDFIMKLTPQAIAAGIIGASHELGDKIGSCFIGTTGVEQKNVFLNLRYACLNNKSASCTFYGGLGGGKSFNANLLTYLHILYGGYGLIIDPKGERTHWMTDLHVLSDKGLISLVTLSSDEKYRGRLDPFNIFRGNVAEGAELAMNILTELFKIHPQDLEYVALLEAMDQVKKAELPSLSKVAEILCNFPAEDELQKSAKLLARRIELLKKGSGMAQLIIGDGTEKALNLNNRLNILQIQNLKLPSRGAKKEDYSQEETISYVLMTVIAAFTRKFIHSHENNFKIALFDESWMISNTTEGEKLISYASRMSRSLYASLILNGHSVLDIPNEGVRNSITYKFCFHTDSYDEAERMLHYMNLEKTENNLELIMRLKNGQCLFQDLNGHVGILSFDAVFQDLIEIFSTTPVDVSQMQNEGE